MKIDLDLILINGEIPILKLNPKIFTETFKNVHNILIKLNFKNKKYELITVNKKENSADILFYIILSWNLLTNKDFIIMNWIIIRKYITIQD